MSSRKPPTYWYLETFGSRPCIVPRAARNQNESRTASALQNERGSGFGERTRRTMATTSRTRSGRPTQILAMFGVPSRDPALEASASSKYMGLWTRLWTETWLCAVWPQPAYHPA